MTAEREDLGGFFRRSFLPLTVFVQIARPCNLRCRMCGHQAWQRNTGFMSEEVFERVISEMQRNRLCRLALTAAQGEPLLAPKAGKFIDRAIDSGLDVHVNTNGTPLSSRIIVMLTEAAKSGRLSVQVSFAGYDAPSYEKVYVGAKFNDVVQKLVVLNASFTKAGCAGAMTVRGVVYSDDDRSKTLAFLKSIGIDEKRISLTLPDNFAGIVPHGRSHVDKTLQLCPWLVNYVVVYDDGKVSACACRDSEGVMEIGDLMTQSLADICSTSQRLAMVNAFMARSIDHMPLCAKCDVPYV